jgi:hypothetical protein
VLLSGSSDGLGRPSLRKVAHTLLRAALHVAACSQKFFLLCTLGVRFCSHLIEKGAEDFLLVESAVRVEEGVLTELACFEELEPVCEVEVCFAMGVGGDSVVPCVCRTK